MELPEELIAPSRAYSTQGRWSGSEDRHRQHYVAMIPISRYNMPDDDERRYEKSYIRIYKHGWDKPRKEVTMTDEDKMIINQFLLAGQLQAMVMGDNNPRIIKGLVKQIDPDILQGFLDKNPDVFVDSEVVQQAIRLVRTFKSLSKA